MSDPVTNAEVEDVLSSIRRLVSEDKRPIQPVQAAPQAPQPASDRLVLTPALRVAEDAPTSFEPSDAAADSEGTLEQSTPTSDVAPIDETMPVTDGDDVKSVPANDATTPQTDIRSLVSADTLVDVYPDTTAAPETPQPTLAAAAGIENDYADDPYGFDDEKDFDGEGDEAILAAINAIEVDPAQDRDGDGNEEDSLSNNLEPDATVAIAPASQPGDLPKTTGPVLATSLAPEEQSATKAIALSAKIAALETAIGKIADTWEPDDTGESDYAGTDADEMTWEADEPPADTVTIPKFLQHAQPLEKPAPVADIAEPILPEEVHAPEKIDQQEAQQPVEVAEAPADATPEPEPAPSLVPDAAIVLAAEEQLLDEEALRDLVSEIVRAELQGALGERITRNVRKLVRREIHRALAAQDLE